MITYYDEFGNNFDGPYGVGTFLGDQIASYPTETAAREAAVGLCTANDYITTVYGPPLSTKGCGRYVRARTVTSYKWDGVCPREV